MREKEFTWRGKTFVWNGRRGIWICEQPDGQADWFVTMRCYWLARVHAHESWDEPPDPNGIGFANAGWLAHLGHGDAAQRNDRTAALEASLILALRFHHARIAELRLLPVLESQP